MCWNLKKFESTMKAKKVVLVYAEVEHNGVEFRVYPNGFVEQYQHNTWWWEYNTYEDDYDVIQAAGLVAIRGE